MIGDVVMDVDLALRVLPHCYLGMAQGNYEQFLLEDVGACLSH